MNSSKKLLNQNKKDAKKSSAVSAPSSRTTLGSGTQGSNTKAIVLGVFCVLLVLVLCIGVGVQQFQPQNVLKVNDTVFDMDDMMYPIYERESEYLPSNELYEQYLGTSVWDTSYMGDDPNVDTSLSNSEGLKQEIINAETEYEVLYQEAVKADYELTDDEKKDAEEQAEDALKGLSWSQKVKLCISKNNLEKRFQKRILADRYKEDKQQETDATVDETEAIADVSKTDLRQYDIEYYYFSADSYDYQTGEEVSLDETEIADLEKQLKKLAKKAKKAEDFTALLEDDSDTEIAFEENSFTEEDGWSDYLSDDNLAKIKKLKNGEISSVIADADTGYYMFVRMVDNNSAESYDEACDEAVETAKTEAYYTWLDGIKEDYTIKTYDSVWDDVTIGTVTTSIVTADDLSEMAESDSSDATSGDE